MLSWRGDGGVVLLVWWCCGEEEDASRPATLFSLACAWHVPRRQPSQHRTDCTYCTVLSIQIVQYCLYLQHVRTYGTVQCSTVLYKLRTHCQVLWAHQLAIAAPHAKCETDQGVDRRRRRRRRKQNSGGGGDNNTTTTATTATTTKTREEKEGERLTTRCRNRR